MRNVSVFLVSTLVMACTVPPPSSLETGGVDSMGMGEEPCAWDTPTDRALGWSEAAISGASAADLLGFGVGTFSADFFWDDQTDTPILLTTAPGGVWERTYGPECPMVSLLVEATWGLETMDGRVSGWSGGVVWFVEEASPGASLGSVTVGAALELGSYGLSPLSSEASASLRGVVREEGGSLTVSIEERWAVDTATTRSCVRGHTQRDAVTCRDDTDTAGPK